METYKSPVAGGRIQAFDCDHFIVGKADCAEYDAAAVRTVAYLLQQLVVGFEERVATVVAGSALVVAAVIGGARALHGTMPIQQQANP